MFLAFKELKMQKVFEKIANRFHYTMESIKNRYPCKIIAASNLHDFSNTSEITFTAVTKINIRTCPIEDIVNDPLLIEKFHPTDTFKLGFISFSEILLKDGITIDEARDLYKKISTSMFKDI